MKRYLCILFVFAWVLCMGSSVSAMDVNADNAEMKTASIKAFSENVDPGFDLLFSGVNVLSGQPLRRGGGVKNSLLTPVGKTALEELDKIVGFRLFTGGGMNSSTFTTVGTIDELAESRMFGQGVDMYRVADVAFKVSVGAQFNASQSRTGNTSFNKAHETFVAVMEIQRDIGRNSISDINSLRAYNDAIWAAITPDARAALTSGSILELFNIWGTHVITSYSLGGQAQTFTTIIRTEESSNEVSSILKAVGGGFGVGFGPISFGVNRSKTTMETAEILRREYNFQVDSWSTVIGGNAELARALNPNSEISDYERWMNSIDPDRPEDTTDIIINDQLTLTGIWELLPPQPQYEARRAEIQKVYLELLNSTYKKYYEDCVFSKPTLDTPEPPVDGVTLISTAQDLDNIRYNLNGQFLLTNDIDLSGFSAWTPIGTNAQPFRGVIYGNGNIARNVKINIGVEPGYSAPGLFGYNEGSIQNLGVEYNSSFSGSVAGVTRAPGSVVGCEASIAYKGTPLNNPRIITTINAQDLTVSEPNVLIDFSDREALTVNSTITVADTVQTIIFRGHNVRGSNCTGLNIVVQGNTTVVFENFHFTGSTGGAAIRFNGSNPVIISTQSGVEENIITGSGEHPTIHAANNLFIGGDADLTINHSLTQTAGAAGAAGQNAIYLPAVGNSTLTIAMAGAKLIAEGSVGQRGTHYENSAATGNQISGLDGGNGGAGGHAISAMRLNILDDSRVEFIGGQGGNGGQGQHGGNGTNATSTAVGRNGGNGGLGGEGGRGGDALNRVTLSNFVMSPRVHIVFRAGAGGTGGRAGNGGNGGQGYVYPGGKDSDNLIIPGGNGGNARNPGLGGDNGSFAEFRLSSWNISPDVSTGRGNDGAFGTGGLGGSYGGSAGTNQGTRRADYPGVTVVERPAGESIWFNPNRLIINETPAAPTFYQGLDKYDPTGYKFSVPIDDIDFHFDFSQLGVNLVTAIYRIAGLSPFVRYLPVMVIEPIVEGVEIRPPQESFSVGDSFMHEGHLLTVYYSDRSIRAVTDRLNFSLPAGFIFNQAGRMDITVSSPELPGWSSTYSVTVQELEIVEPTVLVGAQTGALIAGIAGIVTFPVTTSGIADGVYNATVANLPNGVSVQEQVTVNNNSAALTLAGNASTVSSVTNSLTMTINGVTSAAFSLTITAPVDVRETLQQPETRPLPGVPAGNVNLPAGTVIEPDGAITLPPGAGATINLPNNGHKIWIPGGSVIAPDGAITLGEGDGKITTSGGVEVNISGGAIKVGADGSIILPPDAEGTINPPNNGPEILIPGGFVITPDGTIILGEADGRIITSGGVEVGISGGAIKVEADGSIMLMDNVEIFNDEVTITFSKNGRGRILELATGEMLLIVEQGSATVSSRDINVDDILVAAGYEITISQDGSLLIAKSDADNKISDDIDGDNKSSGDGGGGGGCQLTGYLLIMLLMSLLLLIKRRA